VIVDHSSAFSKDKGLSGNLLFFILQLTAEFLLHNIGIALKVNFLLYEGQLSFDNFVE